MRTGRVLVALLAGLFWACGSDDQPRPVPTATATIEQATSQSSGTKLQLGTLVSAIGVDRNGCPTESASTFAPNQSIYVVAPYSNIPRGTTVFVRLSRENNPIEDAPEITADKDYFGSCVYFVFQPTGADFVTGNYDAQFFINGDAGPSITFKVQK